MSFIRPLGTLGADGGRLLLAAGRAHQVVAVAARPAHVLHRGDGRAGGRERAAELGHLLLGQHRAER